MTTPATKVAIATRIEALNKLVKDNRATAISQADERRDLAESCRVHGDHVPHPYFAGSAMNERSLAYRCEFCELHLRGSAEQLSRNLNRGPH